MAAATLSTLPVMILFMIVQRRLISGFPGGRAVAARNVGKKVR
jgi:ABC-type maltose transport system permease subunit